MTLEEIYTLKAQMHVDLIKAQIDLLNIQDYLKKHLPGGGQG